MPPQERGSSCSAASLREMYRSLTVLLHLDGFANFAEPEDSELCAALHSAAEAHRRLVRQQQQQQQQRVVPSHDASTGQVRRKEGGIGYREGARARV